MKKPWITIKGMSPSRLVFLFFLLFGIGYYLLCMSTPMGSFLQSGGGTGSTAEAIVNLIALPGAVVALVLYKVVELLRSVFGFCITRELFIVIWFAAQLLTALLAAGLVRLGGRLFRGWRRNGGIE